jgi:hypothetical protein
MAIHHCTTAPFSANALLDLAIIAVTCLRLCAIVMWNLVDRDQCGIGISAMLGLYVASRKEVDVLPMAVAICYAASLRL